MAAELLAACSALGSFAGTKPTLVGSREVEPSGLTAVPQPSLSTTNPASSWFMTSGTSTPNDDKQPPLGAGWVVLEGKSTDQPTVRSYVCPWIELAGDLPVYSYHVVQAFPHDQTAYTQGLIYAKGILFESTGLRGDSSLRKVNLPDGKILKEHGVTELFFAEGIALMKDRIYQLTWQEQTGFIYDAETLQELARFSYQREGWGLTNDHEILIMSDGTERLTFIDPYTLKEVGFVNVFSESYPVQRLNELEFIEGEVWANIYQTSCIARIDRHSGQVLGWIDISNLLDRIDLQHAEVPNGIAYEAQGRRIFVTGKYWPKLFEIEVIPVK